MNREKGLSISPPPLHYCRGGKIKKQVKKITIYLVEKGAQVRTKAFSSQLAPKDLYPQVELIGRTLYDLTPGKIHVIDINTLKDFGVYLNQREL